MAQKNADFLQHLDMLQRYRSAKTVMWNCDNTTTVM